MINESLRISTTVPVILRKPDHDIEVGDYTIPAGWNFMGYPSAHFDPKKYEDPLVFDLQPLNYYLPISLIKF